MLSCMSSHLFNFFFNLEKKSEDFFYMNHMDSNNLNGNSLTLKIRSGGEKILLLKFQSTTIVYDALKIIREKLQEATGSNDGYYHFNKLNKTCI